MQHKGEEFLQLLCSLIVEDKQIKMCGLQNNFVHIAIENYSCLIASNVYTHVKMKHNIIVTHNDCE